MDPNLELRCAKRLPMCFQPQDFFVWCCGTGYDARLFYDFQVSAALLVHDAEQFKLRVAKAVEAVLPRMQMIHGPLRYYDAYTEDCTQLTPIFSKNLKYLYQNE